MIARSFHVVTVVAGRYRLLTRIGQIDSHAGDRLNGADTRLDIHSDARSNLAAVRSWC